MSKPASRRGLPTSAGVSAPADRRFRRSDVRPDRRRGPGRMAWRILRWAVPVALVVAVALWAADRVMASSLLEVRHVTVRGNERLSTGEVASLVEDMRGQNIFKIDFEQYRRRVLDSPWVADVTLARVLPGTIDLRVVERTPMAIARLGQQLYLVDVAGVIVDEYSAQYQDFDLPIVDGLLSTPAKNGPIADPARVALASDLLAALDRRPDIKVRLSHIDVSNERDAVVMFDSDVAWLHLGDREFLERLTAYLELVPMLRERFPDMDYVDLRFDERVFVRARGRDGTVARPVNQ